MAPPEDVTAALAEIQAMPYYQIARTFSDDELVDAINAGLRMGIHPPPLPSVLTPEAVYAHGAYWSEVVSLAQVMFR